MKPSRTAVLRRTQNCMTTEVHGKLYALVGYEDYLAMRKLLRNSTPKKIP